MRSPKRLSDLESSIHTRTTAPRRNRIDWTSALRARIRSIAHAHWPLGRVVALLLLPFPCTYVYRPPILHDDVYPFRFHFSLIFFFLFFSFFLVSLIFLWRSLFVFPYSLSCPNSAGGTPERMSGSGMPCRARSATGNYTRTGYVFLRVGRAIRDQPLPRAYGPGRLAGYIYREPTCVPRP